VFVLFLKRTQFFVVDGLLLKGGPLVRRKGGHDRIRQTQDPRAGRKLQPPRLHSQRG